MFWLGEWQLLWNLSENPRCPRKSENPSLENRDGVRLKILETHVTGFPNFMNVTNQLNTMHPGDPMEVRNYSDTMHSRDSKGEQTNLIQVLLQILQYGVHKHDLKTQWNRTNQLDSKTPRKLKDGTNHPDTMHSRESIEENKRTWFKTTWRFNDSE